MDRIAHSRCQVLEANYKDFSIVIFPLRVTIADLPSNSVKGFFGKRRLRMHRGHTGRGEWLLTEKNYRFMVHRIRMSVSTSFAMTPDLGFIH